MADLKPCPFCGNKPHILKNAIKSSASFGTWAIFLDSHDPSGNCILHGRVGFHSYVSEKDAIAAWNNRSYENKIRAQAVRECAAALEIDTLRNGSDAMYMCDYAAKIERGEA